MAWEDQLDDLKRRRELALQMGGSEGVAKQHERGKLTVRERVELLLDQGSFTEFGILAGRATYNGTKLTAFTPKGEVNGSGTIDGRQIMLNAGDFTVRGGSGAHSGGLGAELRPAQRALQWQVPYVRLLDSSGGSVSSFAEMGRTYLPDGNVWTITEIELLQAVPVVSAVLGSVAGLPAINACLSHFNVMVQGLSQLFPGGPPVVKAALGIDIDKEELGGADVHTKISGVINNVAESEKDAFDQIRQFLSYLPSNINEMAPRNLTGERTPVLPPEKLRDIVPANPRQPADVRKLLRGVVDPDSFFEIAPHFGRSRITGLARIDGYPVGIMVNNPRHLGGSTDVAAGSKAIHLIQLCDQFHLPLVDLADEPGFMVGLESEHLGIELAGARLVWATCRSRMPWMTVVIGRLFGVGGQSHHRPSGMFRRYAWPSARWGSMHISGGTSAAYRRVIEAADDPAAKLREIEEELEALASPFRTAEATGQDIIDPADTRACVVQFVEEAQRVLQQQLGPAMNPYRP